MTRASHIFLIFVCFVIGELFLALWLTTVAQNSDVSGLGWIGVIAWAVTCAIVGLRLRKTIHWIAVVLTAIVSIFVSLPLYSKIGYSYFGWYGIDKGRAEREGPRLR